MGWPSEDKNEPQPLTQQRDLLVLVCHYPHVPANSAYLHQWIRLNQPQLVVVDAHPNLKINPATLLGGQQGQHWDWLVNSAALGSPKVCLRRIHVACWTCVGIPQGVAPMYLYDVVLPSTLGEYLQLSHTHEYLEGTLTVTKAEGGDLLEPTPLGWLAMDPSRITPGLHVRTEDRLEAVVDMKDQGGAWRVVSKSGAKSAPACRLTGMPTRYQVFSPMGACLFRR